MNLSHQYKNEVFELIGMVTKLTFSFVLILLPNNIEIQAQFSGKIKKRSTRIRVSDIVILEVNLHKDNSFKIIRKVYKKLI